MSRIGKQPVTIPAGVEANLSGRTLTVKGAKGEDSYTIPDVVDVKVEDGQVVVTPSSNSRQSRAMHGTVRSLVANMVEGGFSPMLSADRLAELGVTIGLFPVTALLAVTAQLQAVYGRLRADGIGPTPGADMRSISDLHGLMGLDEVQQFEERWND